MIDDVTGAAVTADAAAADAAAAYAAADASRGRCDAAGGGEIGAFKRRTCDR